VPNNKDATVSIIYYISHVWSRSYQACGRL